MPGSPLLKRSLFFIQSDPQPVLKKIASPGLMSLSCMFCRCSAARTSATADLLARIHHAALHGLDVDQMAAREQRLQLLGAELLQAVGVADLGGGEAVVEMHLALVAVLAELDADMAEAVELRADLADLGGEKFVVIDQLVRAERAAGRAAGNAQREGARAEQRHALLVGAADLVDLAVADPLGRVEHLGGRDVVRGAGLVGRAPFRRPPFRRRPRRRSGPAPA